MRRRVQLEPRASAINVRLPHAAAGLVRLLAALDRCSLNCWIARAVDQRLHAEAKRLRELAPLHSAMANLKPEPECKPTRRSFDVVNEIGEWND